MPADWIEKYDYVTIVDTLHDLPFVSKGLLEMQRTLKKGGYLSVIDINVQTELEDNLDDPSAPLIYGLGLFNCVPTSLSQSGDGMGAAWGREKAIKMIKAAGFSEVEAVQELGKTFTLWVENNVLKFACLNLLLSTQGKDFLSTSSVN